MLRALLGLSLACVVAGCGGTKRVPVTGTLIVAGTPLAGAYVRLIPTGSSPGQTEVTGYTADDGSFTLKDLRNSSPGAVPGDYKVVVGRWITSGGKPLPVGAKQVDYPDAREQITSKLNSPTDTPLTTTIPPGGGAITIDIPKDLVGSAGPRRS
jgi:hypothetical protein